MAFSAAGMTAFYMFRLTIIAFHGKHKTEIAKHTKENKLPIILPLVILAFLSLWFFYSPSPINASGGWFHKMIVQPESAVPAQYQWSFLLSENTEDAVPQQNELLAFNVPQNENKNIETPGVIPAGETKLNKFQEESEHFHYKAMFLSLLVAGCGILLAFAIYQFKLISADKLEARFKFLHTFSYKKWYFDELYKETAIAGTLLLSKSLSWFDNNVVDGLVNLSSYLTRGFSYLTGLFDNYVIDGAVNFTASFTGFCGSKLRKLQNGQIQSYIVFVLLGILIIFYFFI
jgi:NADH-quinone oxidoreductase subunit L